jgi:hypothetical protein
MCAALIICLALPAVAQRSCFPRAVMIKALNHTHNEAVRARGVVANGAVLEVWQTKDGSSWSLTFTNPSSPRVTCMFATGTDWEWLVWFVPAPGEDS